MRYENLIPNFFEKTTSSEKRDVFTLYIYLIKFSNIYMICNYERVIIIHLFENILSLSGMFQQAQHSNSLIHVVRLLQQMNGCFKLLTDRYSYGVSMNDTHKSVFEQFRLSPNITENSLYLLILILQKVYELLRHYVQSRA